ncbi:hypothetical protein HZU77_006520 [Neisseriaceae bacterium TC5R-5]|nr:hypothetical protein [Neisseriaceae bacterium TC5R-5]
MIPEWRRAWHFASVKLAALLFILSSAREHLPELQHLLPEDWAKWAALAIFIARIVRQDEEKKE